VASGTSSVCESGGSLFSFFEPTGDRITGDAEGASQTTQTAALIVSAQDHFALTLGITIGSWVISAITSTVVADVALFAILGQTVTSNVGTLAMPTPELSSNHEGESNLPLPFEPLPRIFRTATRSLPAC